ncbi:hypothetical protein FHR92_005309 [Fontibacillus solani]|uniref:Uncharacterized protein n=1 Tax=Fontibacillus solani TaxID=1572857 RepID=A0A7W3XUM0_9BACL|nr:hypothetical protein [Fontibacillus solani]MBA9088776.1 hypothetical protein [Fontibacillus solani]
MSTQYRDAELFLVVIDGHIEESQKIGFASVTTHALNVIKSRYNKLLKLITEKDAAIKELQEENEKLQFELDEMTEDRNMWRSNSDDPDDWEGESDGIQEPSTQST